jgi:hypothetical protein
MATPQVKTVRKTAPAARSNPIRKTAGKPKAASAVLKLVTTKAANKEKTGTSAPKPASMTGPLPPIVTLKHLAEWAGLDQAAPPPQCEILAIDDLRLLGMQHQLAGRKAFLQRTP